MIEKVMKRRFRRNGVLRETKSYYLRYRVGDMAADKWVSLRCTDKQAAQEKARELLREIQQEQAGLIPSKPLRDGAKRSLAAHLKEYVADLERRHRAGGGGRGARLLKSRIERLLKESGWIRGADVTADSFQTWRSGQDLAAKTSNHYLQGMSSFLNWLVNNGRLNIIH